MATPHVTGVAALYLQTNPTASPTAVSAAITAAATPHVVKTSNRYKTANNNLLFTNYCSPPGRAVRTAVGPALRVRAGRASTSAARSTRGPVDVEVQHQPDPARAHLADQHALGLRGLGDHRRGDVVQHDHVGLDRRRVDAEPLGQQLRVLVVLAEPRQVVVEGVLTAAARTPTCRMPPPSRLRHSRAVAIRSAEATSTEPTGVPRPLEKQTDAVSASRP